jgi:MoaA/NifB/PqqE/SkfB family radical SAM enzyme
MLRGLDRLLRRNVGVVLKTPLTHFNEAEMVGMRRLADERGVFWRIDFVLTPRDDGDMGSLAYCVSLEATERVFRELAALGQLPRRSGEGGTNCGLGRTAIAVDPEGNVFPCLQWRRAPLGNVRDAPLREVWASSPERLAAAAVARAASDRMVEMGGALDAAALCPALALQRTGDPRRPDESHREEAEIVERIRLDPR